MASEQLRCFPDHSITSHPYYSAYAVADGIEELSSEFQNGNTQAAKDLHTLFLPESSWDDAGGSQDIANRLCELLKPYKDTDAVDGV